jgi:ribonucleoside-diphosphate reductase alpha chain
MPDYIMRWLASRFLDADTQEELGILTQEVRARKAAEAAASSRGGDTAGPDGDGAANGGGNGGRDTGASPGTAPAAPPAATSANPADRRPPTAAFTDTPPVVPARLAGLDLGPACNQCGGMMQRTGSCYTCSSCGNNTGCG